MKLTIEIADNQIELWNRTFPQMDKTSIMIHDRLSLRILGRVLSAYDINKIDEKIRGK